MTEDRGTFKTIHLAYAQLSEFVMFHQGRGNDALRKHALFDPDTICGKKF
jgi:hypothetical protein